jgi:hypothetical protein
MFDGESGKLSMILMSTLGKMSEKTVLSALRAALIRRTTWNTGVMMCNVCHLPVCTGWYYQEWGDPQNPRVRFACMA